MKKDLNMYINEITGRFNNIHGNKISNNFTTNISSYLYKDLTADECFDLLVKSVNLPSKEELDLIWDKYGVKILKINKELMYI